ncbi:hypothetical protein HMPREF1982_02850 [Clostridiales bacterium oral taxon 876 str. F0540]|nr:hypothetical protein HMPREF1982_02850 [Clostridiales bacterium oral taxon 876 str. F0540]
MSRIRQIKILVSLDVALITFTSWIVLTGLLFNKLADYRLFLLSLASIFLMKFIYFKSNNKYLAIAVPAAISGFFLWVLFNGTLILYNFIFVIGSMFINLKFEELPVEYEEHRLNSKQGAIILGVLALTSLWMEKSVADYVYRFLVNYIIVSIVLLKESRSYSYKVEINNAEKQEFLLIDILKKYGIVIVSTTILTTDWLLNKSINIINGFSTAANFIIDTILDLIRIILEPFLLFINRELLKLVPKNNILAAFQKLSESLLSGFDKNVNWKKDASLETDKIIVSSTLKGVALLIIVLFIIDAIYKMKIFKHKHEQYVEEKEKIYKDKELNKDYSYKNGIQSLLKKIFRGNKTLRDKILDVFKDFEKVTEKAGIYKTYMTASELKVQTKVNLQSDDYLDEMVGIYNEVKFSNCQARENQLELVKKAFDNIKKQL